MSSLEKFVLHNAQSFMVIVSIHSMLMWFLGNLAGNSRGIQLFRILTSIVIKILIYNERSLDAQLNKPFQPPFCR